MPALILDCDAHIDLERDEDAKQKMATEVQEFFTFVKAMKKSLWKFAREPGYKGRDAKAAGASGVMATDIQQSIDALRKELGVEMYGGGAARVAAGGGAGGWEGTPPHAAAAASAIGSSRRMPLMPTSNLRKAQHAAAR